MGYPLSTVGRHCLGQWGRSRQRGPFLDYIPHVAKAEQGALRFPTQVMLIVRWSAVWAMQ